MDNENIKKIFRQMIVEFTIPNNPLNLFSYVIRFFQWKWWKGQDWSEVPSHVRIRFFDRKHEIWWVYEAAQTRIGLFGWEVLQYKTKVLRRYEYYVSPETKSKYLKWMAANAGKPYGFLSLIGLLIMKILRLVNIKISNPFADGDSSQVCVEAIFRLMEQNEDFNELVKSYKPDNLDLYDMIKIMDGVAKWQE